MKNIKYNFGGERFLVTGASSDIGKQVVLDLAEAGGMVLAVSLQGQQLRLLKERHPSRIEIAEVDAMDIEAMASVLCAFVKAHGKLEGCVHATGAAGMPTRKHDAAAWHAINTEFWVGLHLMGLCIKQRYYAQGASNVLFYRGAVDSMEQPPFICAAAKAAVKTVAQEIGGKGYRVNAVEFGWLQVKMNGAIEGNADVERWRKRHVLGVGEAADVSHMALFLLSDAARWITGTNMTVDGGFSAS